MDEYKSEMLLIIPTDDESKIGTEITSISEQYETEAKIRFCRSFGITAPSAIGIFKDYIEERDDYAFSLGFEKGCSMLIDNMVDKLFLHSEIFLMNWFIYEDYDEDGNTSLHVQGIKTTNSADESGKYIDVGPLRSVRSDDSLLIAETDDSTYICFLCDCNFGIQGLFGKDFSGYFRMKRKMEFWKFHPELKAGTAVMLLGNSVEQSVNRLYYRPAWRKTNFIRSEFRLPIGDLRYHGVKYFDMLSKDKFLNIMYKASGDTVMIERANTCGMRLYALNTGMTELKIKGEDGETVIPPCELGDLSFLTKRGKNK